MDNTREDEKNKGMQGETHAFWSTLWCLPLMALIPLGHSGCVCNSQAIFSVAVWDFYADPLMFAVLFTQICTFPLMPM